MSNCRATILLGEKDICKDCMKADVCEHKSDVDKVIGLFIEQCEYFKDKSKFIELPCKVGDTVYYFVNDNLSEYCEVSVAGFHIDKYRIAFEIEVSGRKFFVDTEFLGEKVFLTKEEAEQALAERNNGK